MEIYHYVSEMPQWAQDAAARAINLGVIRMDETGAVSVAWNKVLYRSVEPDLLREKLRQLQNGGGNPEQNKKKRWWQRVRVKENR